MTLPICYRAEGHAEEFLHSGPTREIIRIERICVNGYGSIERPLREPKWYPSQIYLCNPAESRPITLWKFRNL